MCHSYLWNDGYLTAEVVQTKVLDVDTVHLYQTFRLSHTEQHTDQGTLASTCPANYSNL